jgi:HEAT repeat protein
VFKLSPLPRTLPAALRDVGSKKAEVRVSAVRDLGRLAQVEPGEPAVTELERVLLGDLSPAVRAAAAEALADAHAEASTSALLRALGDQHPRVQELALLALGEVCDRRDSRVLRAVEQALDSAAPELRFQALVALGRLRGRLSTENMLRGTRDQDPHVRYIAWRVLEEQWLETPPPETPPESVLMRARAALRDDAGSVRLVAAILLGRSGERAGERILVEAVSSGRGTEEPEDDLAAVELVGDLGLAEAKPGLRRRAFGLFGSSRQRTAFQARVALAKLGDEQAIRAILDDLGSGSRDRRSLGVAAAGQARLAQARDLVAAMRGNEARADQATVTEALERIQG